MTDTENPTINAWASLVIAVSLKVDISSDTQFAQFALFHDIAIIVYRSQHLVLLEEIGSPESVPPTVVHQSNTLESLLRMCGSQLHSIYTVKTKELKRKQSTESSTSEIVDQISFVNYLCMNEEHKRET